MVRHKTRWLLVRLDFEQDVIKSTADDAVDSSRKRRRDISSELTKKDLARCILDSISSSFGIAASGMAQDVQVRLYDELSRLAIIRVARDSCGLVRAAITFLTTTIQGSFVVASVVSVNGSARTAKRVALLEMRRSFRQEQARSPANKELRALEDRLNLVRKIE